MDIKFIKNGTKLKSIFSMVITLRHNLSSSDQKRGSSKSPDTVSQGGHSTNFDAGVGGSSNIRGIEGQIISSVFKTLVTKLVNCKELKNPDNMVSICIVRLKILSLHTNKSITPFLMEAIVALSINII